MNVGNEVYKGGAFIEFIVSLSLQVSNLDGNDPSLYSLYLWLSAGDSRVRRRYVFRVSALFM